MEEPTIRVPVTCPSCTKENLFTLPIAGTAAALLSRSVLKFNCNCQTEWNATEGERQQIREYLAVLGPAASETDSVALSKRSS
jgi:hypothetical protein